jgi:hypothetical protein
MPTGTRIEAGLFPRSKEDAMTETEREKPGHPAPETEKDRDAPERRPDPDEDQIGILPGRVPGHPTDPQDPRFPGSQPDLA